MKRLIINFVLILADCLGLNRLFRRWNSDKIRILMYHGVSDDKLPSFYWTLLGRDKFLQQMDYVKRKYNVVSPEFLYKEGNSAPNKVVITFDDGLLNNHTVVLPILKSYEMRAICFVLPLLSEKNDLMWTDKLYAVLMSCRPGDLDFTNFGLGKIEIGSDLDRRADTVKNLQNQLKAVPHSRRTDVLNNIFNKFDLLEGEDYAAFRLMNRDLIKELAQTDQYFIGAHTNSHPILSTMTPDEQEKEIRSGMDKLAEWGIESVPVFAYPNGRADDFNNETVALLKKYDFKAALTTIDGLYDPSDDKFRIKRINIGADTGKWEFRARLSGFFYFLQGR